MPAMDYIYTLIQWRREEMHVRTVVFNMKQIKHENTGVCLGELHVLINRTAIKYSCVVGLTLLISLEL